MGRVDLESMLPFKEAYSPVPMDKGSTEEAKFVSETYSEQVQRNSRVKRAVTAVLLIFLLLGPLLVFQPLRHCFDRIKSGSCHQPKTLEDRVHRILSNTPLFGIIAFKVPVFR
jgi:hypothetical protein